MKTATLKKNQNRTDYKYPENAIEMAREYIDSCGNEQMQLPTIEGLAIKFNVNDDTINEWSKKHEDFGNMIKRLKMFQKIHLINGGMYGGKEINASMFIFLLKANHDMVETERKQIVGANNEELHIKITEDKKND